MMYRIIKRLFDIISSLILLLLISPLLIIVSILQLFALKSFSVFFVDKRVGKNGKIIGVLKFRTMFVDAESNIEKYLTPEQLETWRKERKIYNDPRITKFGKILRKTSLDELPQLINIFVGHMSVVGPRPITLLELDTNFSSEQKKTLLSVRPGLIGVWGVSGRNNITYEDGKRQEIELSYFEKKSLLFDLKLLLLAVPAVLRKDGAQ